MIYTALHLGYRAHNTNVLAAQITPPLGNDPVCNGPKNKDFISSVDSVCIEKKKGAL